MEKLPNSFPHFALHNVKENHFSPKVKEDLIKSYNLNIARDIIQAERKGKFKIEPTS